MASTYQFCCWGWGTINNNCLLYFMVSIKQSLYYYCSFDDNILLFSLWLLLKCFSCIWFLAILLWCVMVLVLFVCIYFVVHGVSESITWGFSSFLVNSQPLTLQILFQLFLHSFLVCNYMHARYFSVSLLFYIFYSLLFQLQFWYFFQSFFQTSNFLFSSVVKSTDFLILVIVLRTYTFSIWICV